MVVEYIYSSLVKIKVKSANHSLSIDILYKDILAYYHFKYIQRGAFEYF